MIIQHDSKIRENYQVYLLTFRCSYRVYLLLIIVKIYTHYKQKSGNLIQNQITELKRKHEYYLLRAAVVVFILLFC